MIASLFEFNVYSAHEVGLNDLSLVYSYLSKRSTVSNFHMFIYNEKIFQMVSLIRNISILLGSLEIPWPSWNTILAH